MGELTKKERKRFDSAASKYGPRTAKRRKAYIFGHFTNVRKGRIGKQKRKSRTKYP